LSCQIAHAICAGFEKRRFNGITAGLLRNVTLIRSVHRQRPVVRRHQGNSAHVSA